MEITIKGEPKEIAALVLAVQERQFQFDTNALATRLLQSHKALCK